MLVVVLKMLIHSEPVDNCMNLFYLNEQNTLFQKIKKSNSEDTAS